jgi:hypothetical protein
VLLRDLLAEIFEDQESTRIVLKDLGLPTKDFPIEEATPTVRWDKIVDILRKQFPDKVSQLVEAAATKFPAYRDKLAAAELAPKPATPIGPVGPAVPPDDSACQQKLSAIREAIIVAARRDELKRIQIDLDDNVQRWTTTSACTAVTLAEAHELQAQIAAKLRRRWLLVLLPLFGSSLTLVITIVAIRSCGDHGTHAMPDSAKLGAPHEADVVDVVVPDAAIDSKPPIHAPPPHRPDARPDATPDAPRDASLVDGPPSDGRRILRDAFIHDIHIRGPGR